MRGLEGNPAAERKGRSDAYAVERDPPSRSREQAWSADELRIWLQEAFGITSIRDIPEGRYRELCDAIAKPRDVPF